MRCWGAETSLALRFLRTVMLYLSLVTLGLATIGTYDEPTVRTLSSLDVSLSTPTDKVASVADLRVIATVKNTGERGLRILKFGTVLDDEHPTRAFIVNKVGEEVPFTGAAVRTPAFPSFRTGGDIHVSDFHRFRPPRVTSPRMTGLSSLPGIM